MRPRNPSRLRALLLFVAAIGVGVGVVGMAAGVGDVHAQPAAGAPAPVAVPLTGEEILQRVLAAPSAKANPEADALVLFEGLFVSYRDGRAEVRRQRLTRIYTEWAIDVLGDPRLAYDRSRQELVVQTSRTFLNGGGTIDTPDNGYNDVTPDGVARSVDHVDLREMVVSHVGLEPGVTVFLDWTVRDTAAAGVPFDLVVFPHGRFPVAERVVVTAGVRGELVTPASALHSVPGPEKGPEGIVWRAENLAAAPHPAGSHAGDELPWIALSSAGSWEDALAGAARELRAAAEARGELATVLEELEKEESFLTQREALAGWTKRVGERTVLVEHGSWSEFGRPRTVERTLARSFATTLERCAVLLAGCREKELEARIVFPSRWRTMAQDVPALASLRPPVLRVVDHAGDVWWVDPVEASVSARPPVPPGTPYFQMAGTETEAMELVRERTPRETSRVEMAVFWDLADGKAKCEGRITGPGAAGLELERPEKLIEEWMSGWCDSSEVEEVRLRESGTDRVLFSGSMKAPLPAEDDRGRVAVNLPVAPMSLEGLLPAAAEATHGASEHVLFSDAPVEVTVRWRLRIPEDRELLAPRDLEAECPGGTVAIRRGDEGEIAEFDYTLSWDGRPVKPGAYPAFRKLLLEVLDERNVRLVLGGVTDGSL